MTTSPNKITAANAGWRSQFRFRGSRHRPSVAELGDFRFMKTHRVLGILWLAFCSYGSFNLLRALLALHPTDASLWAAWSGLALSCLIDLAGIVASIFLFRGAKWPRWSIGSLSVFMLIVWTGVIVQDRSVSILGASLCAFSLISIVMLFLTRHETVP